MTAAEQAIDVEKRGTVTAKNDSRRRSSVLLLLSISLLTLLRSSYTISTNHLFSSSDDTKISSSTAKLHQIVVSSKKPFPIYLIDTSNTDQTTIAASTWGEISANWNRTTQYSNLLSLATAVPSLPNQYSNHNTEKKRRRQIVLIHVGPKLGSTTLRQACRANIKRRCPQINITTQLPPGFNGGDELVSVLNGCLNTHYFCVNQRVGLDSLLLPSENNTTTSEGSDKVTTATKTNQNIEYIHLFPFRNYNEWVKSAIKQLYDRRHGDPKECNQVKRRWENGRCRHLKIEIDIRKYPRIDVDRYQDAIVKRMLEEGKRGYDMEQHTLLLYLHRDLYRTMKEVSRRYQIPMLPGTNLITKGKRLNGTCDPSLEKLYHECFSDSLMGFRWDLPENQLR